MPVSDKPRIILASASPRRRDLLRRIGFSFTVEPSGVDESTISHGSHREFAMKAALAKALDVSGSHTEALVIGADTIVCIEDRILGKPSDRVEAEQMLMDLRGRDHEVITGVAVVRAGSLQCMVDAETTTVFFKNFRKETLERYLESGESLDKAGAYGIQGRGKILVRRIEGDYFNVVGLPLDCLLRALSTFLDIKPNRERLDDLHHPF